MMVAPTVEKTAGSKENTRGSSKAALTEHLMDGMMAAMTVDLMDVKMVRHSDGWTVARRVECLAG